MRRSVVIGAAVSGAALVLAGCTSHVAQPSLRVATPSDTSGLVSAPLPPLTAAQARQSEFGDSVVLLPARTGDAATYPMAAALARGTGAQVTVALVRLTNATYSDRLAWAVISRSIGPGLAGDDGPPVYSTASPSGEQDCHLLLPLDAATGVDLGQVSVCQPYDTATDTSAGSLGDDDGETSSNLQKKHLEQSLGLTPPPPG